MSTGGGGVGGRLERERPNWLPLERQLERAGHPDVQSLCASFIWVRRGHGIEFYKHVDTGRYLLLDSDQNCWRYGSQGLEPANFERQLAEALASERP